MAGTKPGAEIFTQNWEKTISWAKQNHIPYNAYYPVYQMDSQRFLSGTPMSEAERIRAIQAAYGLNYSTAQPMPDPATLGGFLSNTKTNAANIFTGLEPQNLVANIFDTIKNTVEHPSVLTDLAPWNIVDNLIHGTSDKLAQKWVNDVLAPHSIMSWVPGAYDVAMLSSGQGRQLISQPITALLDVLPIGRMLPSSLAASDRGLIIANKIGATTDELAKMDSIQLAWRYTKSLTMPGETTKAFVFGKDAEGNMNIIDVRPMQIGERINAFRNTAGIGRNQGDVIMGVIMKSEEGTKRVELIAGPAVEALKNLKKEEAMMAIKAIATDHRPIGDIMSDDSLPADVRNAIEKVHEWGQWHKQIQMAAGKLVEEEIPNYDPVTHSFERDENGNIVYHTETYSTKPGDNGALVIRAKRDAVQANRLLNKISKPFDALVRSTQAMDAKMSVPLNQLHQMQQAVYNTIQQFISHSDNETLNSRLHETLPSTQRIEAGREAPLFLTRAERNAPTLRNLFGLPPEVKGDIERFYPEMKQKDITVHQVNALRDLFTPGGLIDHMYQAFEKQDWEGFVNYARVASRRFNDKGFDDIPTTGNAVLFKAKQMTELAKRYAVRRKSNVDKMKTLLVKVTAASKKAAQANDHFLATVIEHPPDVWRNVYLDLLDSRIVNDERTASIVDRAAKKAGISETELQKLRTDPQTLMELVSRTAQSSLENGMLPDIDRSVAAQLIRETYQEIAHLRSIGHEPMYIPHVQRVPERIDYNINIGNLRAATPEVTFGRIWDHTASIYNVQAGILAGTKDIIHSDVLREFRDQYVRPFLVDKNEAVDMVTSYIRPEVEQMVRDIAETGVRESTVDVLIKNQLDRMGYIGYDNSLDESIFGPIGALSLDKPYFINKGIADALTKGVQKFQFPAEGFWDRGTKVFRFSILGLSPRYTAHILFGGTWLLAARGHASMLSQLRAGVHMFTTGKLPDDVLEEMQAKGFTDAQLYEHATVSATQEGQADQLLHRATGYNAGLWGINEWLDNHGMAHNMINWVKAAAQLNYRFTRAIVRGQRAIVYLDGASRAMKEGSFQERIIVPRLDDYGNHMIDPVDGHKLYDEVQQRVDMTPERAHAEGMKAVADVMGELRHMTPLERQIFTRIFPFYGWTKHVLTYVLTYPIDHPYRATFLSQLATQNSEDVATGLPTRIQLLMFLGHPDAFGNVSAVDTRFMDPLRDTANYASWTGLFQSLNPVLAAPIAEVDPQIVFGGNAIYPNVTYSQLYGIKTAGPQGSGVFTAAEQFVPQLTALDEAFNLSGQYAYLKNQGYSSQFVHKVMESLNIPFFQIQHVNLRQIAAQNEIDRYSIASNAAYEAATTGDMSYISSYPATGLIPDPLNTEWNVTPAYIEALTQESEKQTGLPIYETVRPPPNPPGI